jgi:uncharacterized damage-inducible protein DinB
MSILNPFKALRSLRKTPALLDLILRDVTPEQATSQTDGPDGWNVLYILCHMRDYEGIYSERIAAALAQDNPMLEGVASNDALAEQHRYAEQDLRAVLDDYRARRRALVAQLEALDDAGWARTTTMHSSGVSSVQDWAINAALHDLDHIEQIGRVLGRL